VTFEEPFFIQGDIRRISTIVAFQIVSLTGGSELDYFSQRLESPFAKKLRALHEHFRAIIPTPSGSVRGQWAVDLLAKYLPDIDQIQAFPQLPEGSSLKELAAWVVAPVVEAAGAVGA
jgi:hypothetical protein